ncbi:hypothetical protein M514_25768 [Trichuris suis]|uniref:DDE-1 domain-containing protein n=1 Tax=Trichuris suis TaxID=68888 RepID=A0A085MXV3_9BILA|nr:hypothetical protein M514_25768 [Trichuris suis]
MTQALFEDWCLKCFVPETREYCRQKNVQLRILLMLDSAPAHAQYISDMHPDVKVVYLPPNTTALIQAMDQGTIGAFKACYPRQAFEPAPEAIESGRTLREF